jgi:hypothetical protein
MKLTQSDIAKESGKRLAESLLGRVRQGLESMRVHLEEGRALEALEARDTLLPELLRLADLLEEPAEWWSPSAPSHGPESAGPGIGARRPLRSPGLTDADPDGLQAFRRAAGQDLEGLEVGYSRLCSTAWRSGADETRARVVGGGRRRAAWTLGLAAALLAGWWSWQWSVEVRAQSELDRAKSETAAEAARLISMAAWMAEKTQGKPLSEIATDMSGECTGINVLHTLPNHPCREAWATNSQALFRAAIPKPGAPVDAPSEVFFDPWGGPYILLIPKEGPPRIVSAGPDGILGSADNVGVDIPYWPH